MIHLLNSAVMPQAGVYRIHEIDAKLFGIGVREAYHEDRLKHYIGYRSSLTVAEEITGLDLGETNRDKTEFVNGDIFYVIRLNYRVAQEDKHRDNPRIEDFEFFKGVYHEF